jgi:hypothetical protein
VELATLGHLVGGRQRQHYLVRTQHRKQSAGDDLVDGRRTNCATRLGLNMVAATLGAVIKGPPVGLVVGRHTSATAAAIDDALAQGQSLSGWTRAGARGIGSQSLLIGQVLLPTDVSRMVVLDHDGPFGARLFVGRVPNGAIGTHDATRTEAPKDVGPGVRGE